MKSKNPIVIILVILFVASTVYEAINAILDGITRTWSPGNTDLIARAMAASVWLVGISFAAFIIAIAVSVSGAIGAKGKSPYKVIDGAAPKMIEGNGYNTISVPGDEVEYVGMEQYQGEYADADL